MKNNILFYIKSHAMDIKEQGKRKEEKWKKKKNI